MTLTVPVKVVRFSSPSTLDASPGTATMGRTREENENRAKVSLYIVKQRFQKARKRPGVVYKRMNGGCRRRRWGPFDYEKVTETRLHL